ncbi:MAG: hypothetical protein RR944_15465, partial [Acinetobacter sp.]
LMQHIEDLTHRIEFKGILEPRKKEKTDQSEPDMTTDPRLEPEQKEENLTIPVVAENKRIPIPEPVEEEPKKRGFLSRFFLPNG